MPADPNHFDIAKVIMIGGWDRGRSGAEAVRQEVRAGDPYGTLNNVFPRVSITPRGVEDTGVVIKERFGYRTARDTEPNLGCCQS
ncbi:hypothetical protein NITHO_760010 [Nitrolancea hollandica Lb]|uniref:Uncharacterized protein n=1 Tax=Nitrolancea hollandica Lb TaxID=1129897 RepID=I4EN68_9BACT|nr:hypothetical protein NITHO_760010 [Nitrolancea hollandica Lb]